MTEWIKCSDRMPDEGVAVIGLWRGKPDFYAACKRYVNYIGMNMWEDLFVFEQYPTPDAWMPIPEIQWEQ